jgi:endonuclease YncB( thermonuclease family)
MLDSVQNPWQWLFWAPVICGLAWLWVRRWRPMRLIVVIDGDTFEALDTQGKRRRIRLNGVDCPELNQRNGVAAKEFVSNLARQSWVDVRLLERDKYRRYVADVRIGGKNLGLLLLKEGLAYPLSKNLAHRLAAASARLSGKGVHRGFGQKKPWQSSSRTWLGRLFHRRPWRAPRK